MLAGIAGAWLARVTARIERASGRLRRWAEARAALGSAAQGSAATQTSTPPERSAGESSVPTDDAAREHGPPAEWLERVRRGAPHLLAAMQGRRNRHGAVVPLVAPGTGSSAARPGHAQPPHATRPDAADPRAADRGAQGAQSHWAQSQGALSQEALSRAARSGDGHRPREVASTPDSVAPAPTAWRFFAAPAPATRGADGSTRERDAETSASARGASAAGRMRWTRWPSAPDVAHRAPLVAPDGSTDRPPTSRVLPAAAGLPTDVAARRSVGDVGDQRAAPDARHSSAERASVERSAALRASLDEAVREAIQREDPHLRLEPFPTRPEHRPPPTAPVWPQRHAAPSTLGTGSTWSVDVPRAQTNDWPRAADEPASDPWPALLEDEPHDPRGHAPVHASVHALQHVTGRQEGASWSV
jgi:hypothetical protein